MKVTPLMEQYLRIKSKYKDCILLFRLGDFYEAFFEDAKIVSRVLNIVLTRRQDAPMAGIPYHALSAYLRKLVEAGYKVAICDQMEEPSKSKKLIRREVTRVITPGAIVEDEFLTESNNYMMILKGNGERHCAVFCDVSTGEVTIFEREELTEIFDLAKSYFVSQVLCQEEMKRVVEEKLPGVYVETLSDWHFFEPEEEIKNVYKVKDVHHFELSNLAKETLGALIKYVKYTMMSEQLNLRPPRTISKSSSMVLDTATVENLSLIPGEKGKNLFDVLNHTMTPMGARLLKKWILHPLVDREEIEKRLDTVETLRSDQLRLSLLRELLSRVRDVERIVSRVEYGRAVPRDLVSLRETLKVLPELNEILEKYGTTFQKLDVPEELLKLLCEAVEDEPIGAPGEGKVIRRGFSEELDDYRDLLEHSEEKLREFEERERMKTGIQKLKVGYNQVFGYYIEVTKANLDKVPSHYERKQTLVGAERFTTPELKEFEMKILAAKEKIEELEKFLFEKVCERIKTERERLAGISELLAHLDVLSTLAYVSLIYNYTRPVFSNDGKFEIVGSRHPIVERFTENFVENDLHMSNKERFVIITGPNMSGKSTFIRQVGLIALMAQMGSFVPAKKAILPVFDRIFTRMGARDDLAGGRSTFLVEMNEMALILLKATKNSLVLLDEVGRGTGTRDGVSIAWAISEELINRGCKVIFATHFTELTELARYFSEIVNKTMLVYEREGQVLFTHKVVDGVADKSYGIEVARLAGIPENVVKRAYEILRDLTKEREKGKRNEERFTPQIPLFPT